MTTESSTAASPTVTEASPSAGKPRVIYVQSRSPDVAENISEDNLPDPFTVSHTDLASERTSVISDVGFKSKSLHNLAVHDSRAGSEYRIIRSGQRSGLQNPPISSQSVGNLLHPISRPARQVCSDEPNRVSAPTKQEANHVGIPPTHQRSVFSKSESNLVSATDTDLDIPLQGAFSDQCIPGASVRIRRSEVAYYHADVERSRKEELIDYISQQVIVWSLY
jgi:hypothetical protein